MAEQSQRNLSGGALVVCCSGGALVTGAAPWPSLSGRASVAEPQRKKFVAVWGCNLWQALNADSWWLHPGGLLQTPPRDLCH